MRLLAGLVAGLSLARRVWPVLPMLPVLPLLSALLLLDLPSLPPAGGMLAAAEATPPPPPPFPSGTVRSALLIVDAQHWQLLEQSLVVAGPSPSRSARTAVLAHADQLSHAPPLRYLLIHGELLDTSREALDRLTTLALAWRFDHRAQDLATATALLQQLCAFPDWNPPHFLDCAELCRGVGLAYDWFAADLPPALHDQVHQALCHLGLESGLRQLGHGDPPGRPAWWTTSTSNWAAVCAGGLVVAAEAVRRDDPDLSHEVVRLCRPILARAATAYAPDGAYPESLAYWAYATSYLAAASCALMTAEGDDGGVSRSRGLDRTGIYGLYALGPSGYGVSFGDTGVKLPIITQLTHPQLPGFERWLEVLALGQADAHAGGSEAALIQRAIIAAGDPTSAEQVLWYAATLRAPGGALTDTADVDRVPLGASFHGSGGSAFLRSSWEDPQALWLALKGGSNSTNHAHHDLGSVELEALGTRWITDLGSDSYALPGYFDARPHGRRWTYFRTQAFAHNLVTVAGLDQRADGSAEIGMVASDALGSFVSGDFSSADAAPVSRWWRGIGLIDHHHAGLIQDEITLSAPAAVRWGVVTGALVELQPQQATLTIGSHHLLLQLLSPPGASFQLASLHRDPPQAENAGMHRIEIAIDAAIGTTVIAVACRALSGRSSEALAPLAVRPSAQWPTTVASPGSPLQSR